MLSSRNMDVPAIGRMDHTVALLREGYDFIARRCDRLGSDVFATRLLLEPTLCMRGRDAAELFYDTSCPAAHSREV